MSESAVASASGEGSNVLELETAAQSLAESHRDVPRTKGAKTRIVRIEPVVPSLEFAHSFLIAAPSAGSSLPKSSEWFLDNYYLIRRVARQAEEDLPRGFIRHLPQFSSGTDKDLLRVDVIARNIIASTRIDPELSSLLTYLGAYQEVTPLTIAELWALPIMLRSCVLADLVHFLHELGIPIGELPARPAAARNPNADVKIDPSVGVERAVRALRVLDVVDWKTFISNASRVDAVLRQDPAGIYSKMDFATRDSYRRVVESLAWCTGQVEDAVASQAVALATEHGTDPRLGHVGYYLVGAGRHALERGMNYSPSGLDRLREAARRKPTPTYLLPLALLTVAPLFGAACWLMRHANRHSSAAIVVASLVAIVPVSVLALSIVHAVILRLLPARILPKLDYSKGVPVAMRTLVVIPTLLGRAEDVEALVRQLELHYLSNPDPQLQFALLTDDVDSTSLARDHALFDHAAHAITALNVKHAIDGIGPFHLLHREPKWNAAEECYMGWERKRGKIEELNRLLRGDENTSYTRRVGHADALTGIRFVITLDSDTQLPMGTAHRLVGLLAHPLNHATFDDRTGRVIAGYTVVQPRVETSPTSSRETLFSRIFAGDIGFDIYTHAVSELYQDLFGAGIYVGKGIYEVDSFMRSVDGRVPENAIVSHDLFEGVHGRAGLASDVVLFESYPSSYATFSKRMHRWVRGDWQLLPWLLPWVPSSNNHRVRNQLAHIDRWKIADNLRRSLVSPTFLALFVLGWLWLPGPAWLWTLGIVTLLCAPTLPAIVVDGRSRAATFGRCALALTFLAHESIVIGDAIARVFVRAVFTRKHMLQWTTAAADEASVAEQSMRGLYWRTLGGSSMFAVGVAIVIALLRPSSLFAAAPLLILWFVGPEIARVVSRPRVTQSVPLRADERQQLRLLARRTWQFFEAFIGPMDQWLPIDNYQTAPHEQTAHRTSPTNIGMMLLSTLSAYDFGYLGPSEFTLRISRTFDSISRLTHHQGHLLNWYDTRNLQPLIPRYVSTVDSGNFAGCLIALKHGCIEMTKTPLVRAEDWRGALDAVELLQGVVAEIPDDATVTMRAVIARMKSMVQRGHDAPTAAYPVLSMLCDATSGELERAVLEFLEAGTHRYEADLLRSLREAIDRIDRQFRQMRRELDAFFPWLALGDEPAAKAITLPPQLRLEETPAVIEQLRAQLETWQRQQTQLTPELEASLQRLTIALRSSADNASTLCAELLALAARADAEMSAMDFRLLYDGERKLFHIGYNLTADQLDANYYDLLASEARLASYLAIVKRDVPEAHWYALGRPLTLVNGSPTLLSWGGTMFEYLMPCLLMRSQPNTLLERTAQHAVDCQIAWGNQQDEPWGVSESAFSRRDGAQTYQYQSFGVPGLGFKRGLEEDRVVTPYASALAVSIRPRAVVRNFAALQSLGMLGTYGLFEALDFDPDRSSDEHPHTVVRSYMAHHQGMLFVALGNLINARSMADRFHADPLVATGELLLNEQSPSVAPAEWPHVLNVEPVVSAEMAMPHPPGPWNNDDSLRKQAFTLGNGRLSSMVTDSGGGGLRWHGLALTRFAPDATRDDAGVWIYLRDEASRRVWLATCPEGRTTYAMHKVELHRRHEGISVHVNIAIAPVDDVEIRQITLHNETDQPRRLTVTSAGRPVLIAERDALAHPAFSSLFVESALLEDLEAIMFARRHQTSKEAPAVMVHRMVHDGKASSFAGYETDRGAFYGRGETHHTPTALAADREPSPGRVGAVLDPIMSLTASVELAPKSSVTLAFVTTVARSRSAAVELARRYGTMHAVTWAIRDAELEVPRRLQRTNLDPNLVPAIQRLFSGLLFSDPLLRASADRIANVRPSKRALWGRGISGDDPIILVRVHDSNSPLVLEILQAQRYLRWCGVKLDLVLLDEQASGYSNDGSQTLRRVILSEGGEDWIGRHGGIYVLIADQSSVQECRLLEASARVVLDTRDGLLSVRLNRGGDLLAQMPRFEPSVGGGQSAQPHPRPLLPFDNAGGGFSEDGSEFVIALAAGETTPAPWCNVLANEQFGCLTSESSLGTTWAINSGENKLTPWRNDPVLDLPSEVVYLRDEETAVVWTPTPMPSGRDHATTIRHGAGYTVYSHSSHDFEHTMTVFVPLGSPLKIVKLRLKNTLPRARRVTATYYAEWVLAPRRDEQIAFIVSEHDRANDCLLATCDWNAEFAGRVAFVASREKLHGFTTDRMEFLGRRGDYRSPDALQRWGLSGSVALGVDPCAALQVHLEIAPEQEIETHFILGEAGNRVDALALIEKFRSGAVVDAAWTELGEFWNEKLGAIRVKTPEPAMDVLLNRWLLYQAISARIFGRIGFYQASGAFGYRDQLQDVLATMHALPSLTRAHILDAAAHQFEEGDVLHWWHPPSGRGVRTRCSDDLLWLPYVTAEYVAATGDVGILHVAVPFLKAEPLRTGEHDRYDEFATTKEPASLFEHCRRAIAHGTTQGAHGLPLMGDGDWNDGMNHIGSKGIGESVWLGWFLCATLDRFAMLCDRVADAANASQSRARAFALRAALKAGAWDGGWYLRAFHDDGSRVGSANNHECRIDSIAQSWAVLSCGSEEKPDSRAKLAVLAADDELVRVDERLVLLFWPPFDKTLHDPGYVRAYPAGIRENGGQYTHGAIWLGWAHAALGDGERAAKIFRLLNPILRTETTEQINRYRIEPYVLAGDIYSCEPWVGRGGWSWYTGSAAWMYRLGVEAILGIQLVDGDLRIDPCIPPEWKGFEAWINVGKSSVHIVVENPDRRANGVAAMTMNGAVLDANRLHIDREATATHEVVVRLGAHAIGAMLSHSA